MVSLTPECHGAVYGGAAGPQPAGQGVKRAESDPAPAMMPTGETMSEAAAAMAASASRLMLPNAVIGRHAQRALAATDEGEDFRDCRIF